MIWDSKKSTYIKVVAVTQEDYDYILETKGRKSLAGRLEQIIKEYKQKYAKNE